MTNLTSLLDQLGIDATSITPFIQYDTGQSMLLSTSGTEALPVWYQLRLAALSTSFWPVLLGDAATLGDHECRLIDAQIAQDSDHIAVTSIINRTLSIDPLEWFRSQSQRYDQHYQTSRLLEEPSAITNILSALSHTQEPAWRLRSDPYIIESNNFSIPTETIYPQPTDSEQELRVEALSTVYIALFPTQVAWHVPAYLAYDAWNDAPSLDGHLLAWRWWGQQHRAEIVGIANNTVEAWLATPPTDSRSIERLVWEQAVYCPDISELADDLRTHLTNASVWTFWWD